MQDLLAAGLVNRPGADALERFAAQRLDKVRGKSGENPERLREVAKEFEALFLSHMLTVMRETVEESGLTGKGLGQSVYTELFDQELARTLAGRGALGISDLLMRRLSAQEPVAADAKRDAAPSPAAPSGLQGNETDEVPDFRMPVQAHYSSGFGIRKDPFTHELRQHRGVDLAAPEGMSVRAACAGRVVFSGYEKSYGNTVVVQHPGGFETRYAHLGILQVRAGDVLQPEQVLGTIGNTGRSTGPHLHFEVSRYGDRIDPQAVLPE